MKKKSRFLNQQKKEKIDNSSYNTITIIAWKSLLLVKFDNFSIIIPLFLLHSLVFKD